MFLIRSGSILKDRETIDRLRPLRCDVTSLRAAVGFRRGSADRQARFGLLLGSIIAAFAVQGIASPGAVEQVVASVLLASTVALALRVADARPQVVWPTVAVSFLVVLASIVGSATGNANGAAARIENLLLVGLAPPAIVVGVVRSLRARGQVTIESLLGALGLYVLLGMFFAFLYGTVARFAGHFFVQQEPASTARCLYYSFTTLTTVGYGDLTAVSNLGHTLSVSESLLGQIYLVTVVSVIVANLGRGRQPRP